MQALKFRLSGRTAFFKKPDVNTFYYFTYGSIHKIALIGMLGAIKGLGGYNQQKRMESVYPEFYEKLKDIKVAIVPKNEKGYIPKKMQVYNNSVGYASKEQGGNLIVKEQWLENPQWDIYILIQGQVEEELANRLMERKFVYIPYLGKNDHIANISNMERINNIEKQSKPSYIDSLFLKDYFEFKANNTDLFDINANHVQTFKYEERLPISLEENTNKYQLESFVFTNSMLIQKEDSLIYKCGEDVVFFC